MNLVEKSFQCKKTEHFFFKLHIHTIYNRMIVNNIGCFILKLVALPLTLAGQRNG